MSKSKSKNKPKLKDFNAIPKYPGGGHFFGNALKSIGDTALGVVGLPNVIQDKNYKGDNASKWDNGANIAGNVGKVASSFIPGVNGIVGVANMASGLTGMNPQDKGMVNPQDQQYTQPYNPNVLPNETTQGNIQEYNQQGMMYATNGGIYIQPSKRGTFTAAATKHGESVQGFASQVLANKDNYSPTMVKKANFAHNAAGWKHEEGGLFNNWSQPGYKQLNAPIAYAHGGLITNDQFNPNAELEKSEVIKYPNGSTDQVSAPSHDNGGIEVNLPSQTKIYSDKLKSSNGITFAKEAEQFKNNKWDKIIGNKDTDPLRLKTANLMKSKNEAKLDQIFNEQETLKQNQAIKAFGKFQKKYGDQIPMMRNGGMLPQYKDGGFNFRKLGDYKSLLPNTFGALNKKSILDENVAFNPYNDSMYGKTNLTQNYIPTSNVDSYYTKEAQSFTDDSDVGTNPNTWFNRNKSTLGEIGSQAGQFLMQNAGNLAYLKNEGKRYDRVNYGSVSPNTLDPTQSINDINRSSFSTQNQLRDPNSALTMTARLANTNNRNQATAGVRSNYDNANAGIKNQALYANQGYKIQGMQDEAANKGAAQSAYYNTLDNIGMKSAGQLKDYRAGELDKERLSIYPEIYKNSQFQNWYNNKYKKSVIWL